MSSAEKEMRDDVISHILKAEGGYSNDPDDKGGPTNWGITQATLSDFRGKPATADDVKSLQQSEAIAIYRKNYWDPMGLDQLLDSKLQLILFDQGVNRGTKTAVIQAQVVANAMGGGLTEDGKLGPVTAGVINKLNPLDFAREYLQASEHAYVNIVIRNPSQVKFLRGWLNRVHALQDKTLKGEWTKELPKVALPVDTPIEDVLTPEPANPGDYFGAKWVGANIDLLGRKEDDPKLNARYVPHWKNQGLPGYKTLVGNDHAWCSLREDADMLKVGVKGTKSAAAKSWSTWGDECPFWFGAALPIRHAKGGRHICDFLYWIDEKKKIAAVYGGNQSNRLSVAQVNLSGNDKGHDEVVPSPRWPKGYPKGQKVAMADVLKAYPHLKVGGSMASTR